MSPLKNLAEQLQKKVRAKMVDKAAEDIASQLYHNTRDTLVNTTRRVAEEVQDEENHQKVREATARVVEEAQRLGATAWRGISGEPAPWEPPPQQDAASSERDATSSEEQDDDLRARLRREMMGE